MSRLMTSFDFAVALGSFKHYLPVGVLRLGFNAMEMSRRDAKELSD